MPAPSGRVVRGGLRLPPADHVLSPRTGWTRAHWEALADRQLAALVPHATPRFAQYRLPGRTSRSGVESDGLEGYARSFLLAAFRIAGAGGDVDPRLTERYAQGLAAGTDPDSGEAWPRLVDRTQQLVEAASVAIALHETRPWIWDRLDDRVRDRVTDWFSGFVGRRTWDNNWRLFQVVSEQFLASVGAPYSRHDIESGLDRIEDWYLGDGWYTDGDGRNFDYYNAWALHLYPLLWTRMAGPGEDGGRGAVYRERLSRFLTTYPRFFGADGAPVHQGRSLTYRYAAVTPVWMGALADCTPLAPGLTRRLASGAVRHFVERGVPDGNGLLPLGWYRPFLPATQSYSGPASPYWASKGFLGLLLPGDHPVWTRREEPLPVEEGVRYTALPAPGWLLHATPRDGVVRLVNHGCDHAPPDGPGEYDPHYTRFAYSTATAPETAPRTGPYGVDNHVALVAADGTPSRRSRISPLGCAGRRASSSHHAELPGHEGEFPVESTSVLHEQWEIRVHRLRAPRGVSVREGGHALADDTEPHTEHGPGWALVRRPDGLISTVVALYGWGDEDGNTVREFESNAYGPHSATPYLTCNGHPGGESVHVSLVALTGEAVSPAEVRASVACVAEGGTVRVTFPDGADVVVDVAGDL